MNDDAEPVPTQAGRRVTDVSKHTFQNGGWIEGQIVVYLNGNMTLHEEYHDIRTNVTLPPDFFEPDAYRTPHWTVSHPRETALRGSWSAGPPLLFARSAHAVVATADASIILLCTATADPDGRVARW